MSYEDGLFKDSSPKDDFLEKDSFEIKKSSINGKGVFVLKDISANKRFYLIPMDKISKTPVHNFARLYTNTFVNDPIILNFVNHSCDPNSEIVLNQRGAFLLSKRKILAGEEITLDYCATEEKNTLIECKCKSNNCRNFFYITE